MAAYSDSVRVGPPTSGRFTTADTYTDANGQVYECLKGGQPGLWFPLPAGLTAAEIDKIDDSSNATDVGAAPSVTGLACAIERLGNFVKLSFTFTALQLSVTDAAGSGSYAGVKIFDFVQAGIAVLGARQDYTAFVEGAALTGGAGDAVFEIGLGSVLISAAADGVLGSTNDDIGGDVNIDLGATGVGTLFQGATAVLDGTTTAADINLNWSGTAATIDANSTIDVTGTATVLLAMLGDD